MGKAGKWIRNFLLGKKEEKYKKIDTFCSENKSASMMDSQMVSPNVKRRWSFGRLRDESGRKTSMVAGYKFSISFDSGDSARLQIQALLETQGSKSLPTELAQVYRYRRDHKTASATKIQAAFHSYLRLWDQILEGASSIVKIRLCTTYPFPNPITASRALHALRGLVKLQALVPCKETNNCYPAWHACVDGRGSKSSWKTASAT